MNRYAVSLPAAHKLDFDTFSTDDLFRLAILSL